MLAQQECSLLLPIRSFLGLPSLGPALPAPSPPSPLSATPPPCPSRQDSIGGGGVKHQGSVLSPRFPLASRAVYTALIGRLSSTLPFTPAVVSTGGLLLRAGYIKIPLKWQCYEIFEMKCFSYMNGKPPAGSWLILFNNFAIFFVSTKAKSNFIKAIPVKSKCNMLVKVCISHIWTFFCYIYPLKARRSLLR